MRQVLYRAALGAALVAALPVCAQEEAVVVTATRSASRVSELVSDVSVITRNQIEQAPQTTLEELLQTQPGLEMWSNGGPGSPASISIRGADPAQTLVLVDGQRMSSASLGTTAIQGIPLSQIERIEILRGPASSLYGADALGGVIQIFTRTGEGAPHVSGEAGLGSYRTASGWVDVGGRSGQNRFNVNFGYLYSGSFTATKPGTLGFKPDPDPYTNRNLSAEFAHDLNSDNEFGARLFYSDGKVHFNAENCDPTFTVCTANFDNTLNQTLSSYSIYSRNRLQPRWSSLVRVGASEDRQTSYFLDPVANAVSGQTFRTNQTQLSWQNDLDVAEGKLLLAADRLDEHVYSNVITYTVTERTTNSLTAGYHVWFHGNTIQASARHDDNSQFGSHDTGTLGYGYQFTPDWRASASVGTAFRAPTFDDLYWPVDFSSFYVGNPMLRPERARNKELRVVYETAGQSASLTLYRNDVTDLINFGPAPAPAFFVTTVNVGSAVLQGATATYAKRFGRWSLTGSYDVLSARDADTGLDLPRRARDWGSVALHYAAARWDGSVQLVAVGPRYEDFANTERMGGFGLVNLQARYPLGKAWSVFARANNVFDKHYELTQGFNTPGATLFVGMRYASE